VRAAASEDIVRGLAGNATVADSRANGSYPLHRREATHTETASALHPGGLRLALSHHAFCRALEVAANLGRCGHRGRAPEITMGNGKLALAGLGVIQRPANQGMFLHRDWCHGITGSRTTEPLRWTVLGCWRQVGAVGQSIASEQKSRDMISSNRHYTIMEAFQRPTLQPPLGLQVPCGLVGTRACWFAVPRIGISRSLSVLLSPHVKTHFLKPLRSCQGLHHTTLCSW
jgi:hypothetical protein